MTKFSEYSDRLKDFFEEQNITDERLKDSIKKTLGEPAGTVLEIQKNIDEETQEWFYDADFESVLELYNNLFVMNDPVRMWESFCGYYGVHQIYVTELLEGISVSTI